MCGGVDSTEVVTTRTRVVRGMLFNQRRFVSNAVDQFAAVIAEKTQISGSSIQAHVITCAFNSSDSTEDIDHG